MNTEIKAASNTTKSLSTKINTKIKLILCLIWLVAIGTILSIALREKYSGSISMNEFFVLEDAEPSACVNIQDGIFVYDSSQDSGDGIDFKKADTHVAEAIVPDLPFGVYRLRVNYDAAYTEYVSKMPPVSLTLTAKGRDLREGRRAVCEEIFLEDYSKEMTVPVYVDSPKGTHELEMGIEIRGQGAALIHAIEINEYMPWRVMAILLTVIIAAGLSWFVLLVGNTDKFYGIATEKKLEVLGAVVVISLASALACNGTFGAFRGHDFDFHVMRIGSLATEIMRGNLAPLYHPEANNGIGYIAFSMYGMIFLYIPALLHILGVPLYMCYNVYIIMVNVVTYFICMYSFSRIFGYEKNKKIRFYPFVGTTVYMLGLYRLTDMYIRSALGEYTAMAFLPLLAYGVYSIVCGDDKYRYNLLPLIIGASGILESHVLSALMTAGFVLVFCLVHFKETIKKIVPLAIGAVITLVLNLFFIVPFLDAYRQPLAVNEPNVHGRLDMAGNSLWQLLSPFVIDTKDRYYGPVCLGAMCLVAIGVFTVIIISKSNASKLVMECFVYGMLCVYAASIYCPWNLLSGMSNPLAKYFLSIQFSFRYLEFAHLFLSIVAIYCIKYINENEFFGIKSGWIAATFLILSIICACDFNIKYSSDYSLSEIKSGITRAMSDELYYDVKFGAHDWNPNVYVDSADGSSCQKSGVDAQGNKQYDVNLSAAGTVTLNLAYYNNLRVLDMSTGALLPVDCSDDGKLRVHFDSPYEGRIVVKYVVKRMYLLGYAVSLLALIGLVVYSVVWLPRVRRNVE